MVQTLEEAYGVPMTSNCMVPRSQMLALLDELRNALPLEIDDAQDVLDRKDEIIHAAEAEAHEVRSTAQQESDTLLSDAHGESERILSEAQQHATALVSQAESDAQKMREDARREADQDLSRAQAEAERLVAEGNDSYQRSVDEGLAEQRRLVSESEVVRRANEEAHRVVDAAHADSTKLRSECDSYVDDKLSEFESTLNGVLRTVTRDRAALRRGAGAAGRGDSRYGERRESRAYDDYGYDGR